MAVIFTEQLRNIINHFKSHPEIVDVTVRSVPQDIVIPSKLSNPIQFLFTVLDRSTNTKSVAAVIVPDTLYNSSELPEIPFEQFLSVANFDLGDAGCMLCKKLVNGLSVYVDPDNYKMYPIMGFSHTPEEFDSLHPGLQNLVFLIKDIPGVTDVVLYKFIDPDLHVHLDTDEAYKCYVYIGNTRDFDARDNISVGIKKEAYTNEDWHKFTVDNIRTLVQQKQAEA